MLAIGTAALRKTYRSFLGRDEVAALLGVDLEVRRGVSFGLVGPNGAGKTSLIKILVGVARPTSGSVRVLGGSPDDPAIRRRIGYVPERVELPPWRTAIGFLADIAALKGVAGSSSLLERQLGRVGLAGAADQRIRTLSKGMRQRLGIAAALLGGPELLVLDEATDGIDPLGRMELRHVLREEKGRGATILVSSHHLSEIERGCDRVGVLAGGQIVREGPIDALCASSSRYRARFAPGCDAPALEAIGFSAEGAGDVFRCEAPDAVRLNELLDRARATGALLVELSPEMRDLEDLLADALGKRA
jgi:ABC-2 type transport system ATP-binding protein